MTEKTCKHRRRGLASIAAGAALACLLALPAAALGQPNITPETTIGELRDNESIIASGFNTMDLSAYWPEQPWEYRDWTLAEYVEDSAPHAAAGLNLLIENYNSGVQVTHKLYTPEEIAADPTKDAADLYYFPAKDGGAAPVKYALVVPGNMFEKSAKMKEGCATAWQLHEMGYAAFVLRYRVGHNNGDNAAYDDLVRAVRYITAHAEEFGVQTEDYAIVGYSAGGQMCGVFGTSRMGYRACGLPRPGALLLGYPVVDYGYVRPMYWLLYDGCAPADDLAPGDYYYKIALQKEIDADFPPTYHWFGWDDTMLMRLGLLRQGPALDKALEEAGVMHKMVVYDHAPHSSSTGLNTDAAGWLTEGVAFWEAAVAAQHAAEQAAEEV